MLSKLAMSKSSRKTNFNFGKKNLLKPESKSVLFHVELTCAGWRPAPALASACRVREQSSLATQSLSDNSLANLLLHNPSSPRSPRSFYCSHLLHWLSDFLSPPLDRSWHQLGRSWTHPVCRTSHQPPTVPEHPSRWTVVLGDRWAPQYYISGDKETWQHELRVLVAVCAGGTPGVLHLPHTASLYRTQEDNNTKMLALRC